MLNFIIGVMCGALLIVVIFPSSIISNKSIEELAHKNAKIIPAKGSVDINCTVRFTDGKLKAFIVE